MILWSEKCACSSLVRWIEHHFHELAQCSGKPKIYLNKNGYKYKSLSETEELLSHNTPIDHFIVSHRDPIKRMTSSFVNKFLTRGKNGVLLPLNTSKLEGFSFKFLEIFESLFLNKSELNVNKKNQKDYNSIIGNLSLEKFIQTITHKSIDCESINGHFSPQIVNHNHWTQYINIAKTARAIYPLRVEKFNQDLSIINQRMGLEEYLPEKKNSTKLPSNEWNFSDKHIASELNLRELCNMRMIPKSASLAQLLSLKPSLNDKFTEAFKFDYQLLAHLEASSE